MPSLTTARRIANVKYNSAKTIGQMRKEESDFVLEETFMGDIQHKVAYIYDYFHDDFFTDEFGNVRTLKEGMSYEKTNKTRIDIKFIVKSYQSMDKDQVDYYVQFLPSQKVRFEKGDELYYYETDYKSRYLSNFPIGLYLDIADSKGVYHKWLICREEFANQFPKYLVLPIDYELMWVERNGADRIKRRMWCSLRNQQSYTSGVYRDRYFAHPDNQNKIWLPMNSITEKFWFVGETEKKTRLIVGALTEHPNVWSVTKVENASPLGLQKLTIYSDFFNEHTDYVDVKTGEMYADFYDSKIEPEDSYIESPIHFGIKGKITTATSYIKVGGSYKTLTINISDDSDADITSDYLDASYKWTCLVGDLDFTDVVIWKENSVPNSIKIKVPNDKSLLGKVLNINCQISKEDKVLDCDVLSLEVTQ